MASPSRLPSVRRPPGAASRSRPVSMIEPGFSGIDLSALDAVTSKSAKRRSLLPQLSRASSAEYKEDQDVERENEEPMEAQVDGPSEVGTARKGIISADRNAMPPPSKTSRPLSTRVPGTSQLGRTPSTRSHTRTQSKESNASSTGPGAARAGSKDTASAVPRNVPADIGLKRTSSTRLPQGQAKPSGLARSSSIRAPQSQAHSRTSSTSIATSTTATKQSSVSNSRPVSMIQTSSTPTPASPTKPTDLRPSGRSQMLPPSRPAFNTFQQHYSPAKSALPKPPIPSSRQARPTGTVEEDSTITFDIARQQLEVLQLSLLHGSSTKTLEQYLDSAHRKLGRKHARLRKELTAIIAAETEHQRVANLEVLHTWSPDPVYLVENLQTLARVHRDIAAVTETGSRYADVLKTFDVWISRAEITMTGGGDIFMNPLPSEWQEAHASVALKVRSLQREMAVLPPLPTRSAANEEPTSLETLMGSCRTLIDGILRELDMMHKLEKEVIAVEKARVDSAVSGIDLGDVAAGSDVAWVPAWQSAK